MMKSKPITYVLGVVALLVWGLIIYRIIKSTGSDDTASSLPAHKMDSSRFNDYALMPDTQHLVLNYPDPFQSPTLHSLPNLDTSLNKKPIKILKSVPTPINWSFITYSGYIHSPLNNRIISLVSIHGSRYQLAEGEIGERVKLLQNRKDSIKILYEGKSKYITMNPSNP